MKVSIQKTNPFVCLTRNDKPLINILVYPVSCKYLPKKTSDPYMNLTRNDKPLYYICITCPNTSNPYVNLTRNDKALILILVYYVSCIRTKPFK